MEEAIAQARTWLRMNGSYDIRINLWGLYGCFKVEGIYLNSTICVHSGNDLCKHLNKTLAELKTHKDSALG